MGLEGLSQRKSQWPFRESNPRPPDVQRGASTKCATAHLPVMWVSLNISENQEHVSLAKSAGWFTEYITQSYQLQKVM